MLSVAACFVHASILATAAPSPGAQAAKSLPGWVQFDGHEVDAARVLVRWKDVSDAIDGPARIESALRTEEAMALGARPTRVAIELFTELDGVGVIEFVDSRETAIAMARGDATTSSAAASLSPTQLKSRIGALRASGLFDYVEPDYIQRISATPADLGFSDGRLWGLRNLGQSGGVSGIDAQVVSAWDLTTGSSNVIVAVIDTGVRYTHRDLAGNMWQNPGEIPGNGIDDDGNGYVDDVFGINAITRTGDPMDDNGHGSHCAGTIGGTANDAGELVGVAWTVRMIGLKFLGANGGGNLSDAIRCVDYAISKGAHIISGSYGGGGFSQATSDSIERARAAGILCVFAAGNETNNNDTNPAYPASLPQDNIVSVAAIDRSGALATFSNFGATSVDLAAPGVQIFSCNFQTDSSYQTISGTSMATPHVAGVAALLKARYPTENYAQIRARLLGSTRALPALQGRTTTGGMVQARAAMDLSADDNLEIALGVDPSPLRAGEPATLTARVTDFSAVNNATLTGTLGATAFQFRNDGVAPDARAGDNLYTARVTVPQVAGSEITLTINATAPTKTAFTGNVTLPLVARAPNDDFANASTLDLAQSPFRTSNADCTREAGEPAHAGNTGGRSIWWTWTAPSAGQVQITTAGSSFDTTLGVYTGNSVSSLTVVASNDDASGSLQSAVQFTAVAGTTYRIAVDGFNAANGAVVLNATFTPTGGGNVAPSIVRPPADTRVQQGESIVLSGEAAGTPAPTLQWTFNGTPLANGGRVSGATSAQLTITGATAADGGEYRLVATNSAGTATSLPATVTVDVALVRPQNDDFAARLPLVGASAQTSGTNTGATAEAGEPIHAGATPRRSVWWTWTAPTTGSVAVDTFGSAFDTVLSIYRGSSLATLTSIASNDDASGSRQSRTTFTAEAGVAYAIAVDSAGADSGAVTLRLLQGGGDGTPPVITRQPPEVSALEGFAASIYVGATGTPPLTYQWWRNGAPLDGATSPLLYIPASQLSDGGSYFVVVTNPFGSTTSSVGTLTINPIGTPPNDDFANAASIATGGEFVVARLAGATRQTGEPNHAGVSATGGTLWWRWSPAQSGPATFSTAESFKADFSTLDTVLAVYTGNALGTLSLVAANDDFDDELTSQVTFNAVAGTTYHIAVGGFSPSQIGILFLDTAPASNTLPAAAPMVLFQPNSLIGAVGGSVTYIVGGAGSPHPAIRWQRSTNGGATWTDLSNGTGVSGVTTQLLALSGLAESDSGSLYRARLSNASGTVFSFAAGLTVPSKPANDDFAAATAIPAGTGTLFGANFGATREVDEPEHDEVGLASVWWTWQASAAGPVAFDTLGSDFDTVLAVYTGNTVGALTPIAANDDFGDSFQSRVEFTAVAGTTYRIAVSGYSGDFGAITLSAPTDLPPALVLEPPASTLVTSGGLVTISVGATGNPAPSIQWQRSTDGGASFQNIGDDATFSGTTTNTLVVTGASAGMNNHRFRAVVTNTGGSVTSAVSILSVNSPAVRLTNLSTRAVSLGGDRAIIPGFVVSGAGTKRVLIRAVGPKLADYGVGGVLPDPVLSVFRSGEPNAIAINDNWTTQEQGRPSPATVGDLVGAAAFTPSPGEPTNDTLSAAIVLDLQAGSYSTVARDSLDRNGIGLLEIYDADDDGPRLVNVSNRGFVGQGDQVMIPGFVVSGTGARRYLVRAVGPKLADFGLAPASLLADPQLTVKRGSEDIASNNDWLVQTSGAGGTSADVQAIADQVGAFSLTPDVDLPSDDQKSAALLVWLEPGVYTVVVSGADGGTGIAIAEIYEVP
ncbi:hypothetical protein ASA1KI_01130 [Opitutales bacterium ASA1]|nr:hypothetical protein ASA1KI_01130 [Opitutales bacterium ASA1]